MVTKEQCLLDRVLNELEYDRNDRLAQYVLAAYNQGKKYASEMVFQNDERGLDQALQGYSPSFIVFSVVGNDSEYDVSAPFFTIDSGIRSIDGYDFQRMLTPEDTQKILTQDVLGELDNSDIVEAFMVFVEQNYPQVYEQVNDFDVLYDMGYRTEYDMLRADWNQLTKELQQYQPQEDLDESKTVKLNGNDLRKITNKILEEILNKRS